jgi:hypothetical protein
MPDLQPIILTPEEYQGLVNDLASRDPLVRFLMQKQEQAQTQANDQLNEGKSMRIVGGTE